MQNVVTVQVSLTPFQWATVAGQLLVALQSQKLPDGSRGRMQQAFDTIDRTMKEAAKDHPETKRALGEAAVILLGELLDTARDQGATA